MRKRLVIGVIAAVAIGVAAYVISQPRTGTVEYHKQKYAEASQVGRIGQWINLNAPAFLGLYWTPKSKRQEFHRNALLEAGYLAEREFLVSDFPGGGIDVVTKMRFELFTNWSNDPAGAPQFWLDSKAKKWKFVARSSDIAKWEDAIRKAEVPETK